MSKETFFTYSEIYASKIMDTIRGKISSNESVIKDDANFIIALGKKIEEERLRMWKCIDP
jgi:hypothetical protein